MELCLIIQPVSYTHLICIIEAMKVMNEIKAPCDGTVTSILVENEALVEYDQALMVIEENV